MKYTLLSFAGACALAMSMQASAQTCASPLPISSEGGPHDHVEADLCTAANSLSGMGGTPSPGNDVVYSFTANAANATIDLALGAEGTWGGNIAGVFLLPTCSDSTDPIAFGFPGTPMQVTGLADGQDYFIVVTSDPGAPATTCGTFQVDVTGTLPVVVQNFVVE